MSTRGGRLPGTFQLVGGVLLLYGLLEVLVHVFAGSAIADFGWPVAVSMLVAGATLFWLGSR